MVTSIIPEYIIGIVYWTVGRILASVPNQSSKGYYGRNNICPPNQKQYCIPGRIIEVSAWKGLKDLKETRVAVPISSSLNETLACAEDK